ncbi:MAG: gliding motility protein GldC [Thermodesulfobacteriota bacterium]
MSRIAEINIKVRLGDDDVPEEILWEASESETQEAKNCEAMFLSMWDKQEKNSLNIDLWTKKMEIPEMNALYFYTMMRMADTYERATNNQQLAKKIRDYANDFANSVETFNSN